MHPLSQLIRFETLSGTLTAERDGEKIALDLPVELTSRNRQTGGDLFEELRTMAEEAMPGSKGHVVAVAMGLAPIIELDSEVILKDMVVDSSVFVSSSHLLPPGFYSPQYAVKTQSQHCLRHSIRPPFGRDL